MSYQQISFEINCKKNQLLTQMAINWNISTFKRTKNLIPKKDFL